MNNEIGFKDSYLEIHEDNNEANTQKETLIQNIIEMNLQKDLRGNLEIEKRKLIKKLTDQISSSDTFEQIRTIKKIVKPIEPTLMALKKKSENSLFLEQNPNRKRNITRQRLYSTKKSRKTKVESTPNELNLINSSFNVINRTDIADGKLMGN